MINNARVLKEFFELVQIRCSTKEERQVADLVGDRLVALGGELSEDDAGEKIGGGNCGNLFINFKGNVPDAPRLMFCAHLDCVEPCGGIQPKLENGIITSVGDTILGADDKSGVVAIMEAIRVIKENNLPHGDIQAVFTVAEEGGVNGSRNMDASKLQADMGFALDASGAPGSIIVRAPGKDEINILIKGRTAHAGLSPEDGVNAVVVAGKALAEIQDGRIDHETTSNVGDIKGGGSTNIVPDTVRLHAETRSLNLAKLTAQSKHIEDTFTRVATANNAVATVNVTRLYEPFVVDEDAPVVQLASEAATRTGLTAVVRSTGGGSDANFFNTYGVPTAVLTTGMSKVHTTDEFIKEEDLYNTARWVVEIIRLAAEQKR